MQRLFQLCLVFSLLLSWQSVARQTNDSIRAIINNPDEGLSNRVHAALTASTSWYTKNTDSALFYAKQAIALAQKSKNDSLLARAYTNTGIVYYVAGNDSASFRYMTNALRLWERQGDSVQIGQMYNNLAILYQNQGLFEESMRNFKIALDIKQRLYPIEQVAETLYNISRLLIEGLKDAPLSLQYLREVVSIATQNEKTNPLLLPFAYNLIGWVHLDLLANPDSGIYYFNKAIATSSTDNRYTMHDPYNSLGISYTKLGQYDKAETYLLKSKSLAREASLGEDIKKDYTQLAQLYLAWNKLSNAKIYIDSLLVYDAEPVKNMRLAESLQLKSDWLAASGDYHNALAAQKESQAIKDSIFSEQTTQKLAFLRSVTEADRLQTNNRLLQNERDLQAARAERETNRRNVFVLATILVLLVAGAIFYRYREKNILNKKLSALNTELAASREALQKSNDAKTKFFGILSHDLRNPLLAFERLTEKAESDEPEQVKATANAMHLQAKSLRQLLNNLLVWSKAEQGLLEPKPKAVLVADVVAEVCDLYAPEIAEKNLSLKQQIDADALAFVDADALQTILRNLLNNAVKFTNEGEIAISVEEKEAIEISISDTGRGIASEKLNTIFELNTNQSSGLGLVLVREMIAQNNGTIRMQSEDGQGTTVFITLPKYTFGA